ncbi:MAG: hypothetical protein AAF434_08710 [Pseudomonadota bacterium]
MTGLTLAQTLVIVSALVMIWGGYAYFRDTLRGVTKPNRVSWFMWALAPLVSIGAAFSADADVWASVRVIVGGVVPALVFLASFINKNSYWALTRFDLACGAFSLLALVFWGIADSPLVAILLATAANTFATIPTFIKAWNYPESETRLTFITSFLSAVIIVPAIPVWTIENAAFQLGLILTTASLLFAVFRKDLGIGVARFAD